MPRLSDDTRRDRRDQIAAAALRCFVRDGFASTSMADIIAESGLSAGSIYSHFDSKAALLRHAIAEVLTARLESLQAGLDSRDRPTPAEVLDQLLLEQDEPFEATASLLLQVWSQVPFEQELARLASDAVTDLLDVVIGALAPWGRERFGSDADDRARDAAGVVLAAMHGFVVRIVLQPGADREELRRSVVNGLAVSG